jgi:hypothetical protein
MCKLSALLLVPAMFCRWKQYPDPAKETYFSENLSLPETRKADLLIRSFSAENIV